MVRLGWQKWLWFGEHHSLGDSRQAISSHATLMLWFARKLLGRSLKRQGGDWYFVSRTSCSEDHVTGDWLDAWSCPTRHKDEAGDDFWFGFVVLADSGHPAFGWAFHHWTWISIQCLLELAGFRRRASGHKVYLFGHQTAWFPGSDLQCFGQSKFVCNYHKDVVPAAVHDFTTKISSLVYGWHSMLPGKLWFRSKRRRYQSVLDYLKLLKEEEPHRKIYAS